MWALTWGNSHYNLQPVLTQWPVESRRELRLSYLRQWSPGVVSRVNYSQREILRLCRDKMTFSGRVFDEFFSSFERISRAFRTRDATRVKSWLEKILPQTSAPARGSFKCLIDRILGRTTRIKHHEYLIRRVIKKVRLVRPSTQSRCT